MSDTDHAIDLLAGPRGRSLCISVLTSASPALWTSFRRAVPSSNPGLRAEFIRELTDVDAAEIERTDDQNALMGPLVDAVNSARYWQPPDDDDYLLVEAAVRDALRPTATAIVACGAASWWSTSVELHNQRYVQWLDEPPFEPPSLSGAAERLARWKAAAIADEESMRRRQSESTVAWSGPWWSTPALVGLPMTTRSMATLGAVQLALVEDGMGWSRARVWPLSPADGCRIYEISGPCAWTSLVEKYPLDVSHARKYDWWRTTGLDSNWLIPDWSDVAADYDAVHLTVSGYLTTAGRALEVGDAHTVLAGWDPDKTYWLTDVLEAGSPTVDWFRDPLDPTAWTTTGA